MITQRGFSKQYFLIMGVMALTLWMAALGLSTGEATASSVAGSAPHVTAATAEEAGRYLVLVGGCNDCHTPGWMEVDGRGIPEDQWLTGVPLGWRGPWGTTYARNLRLTVQNMSADDFVLRAQAGGMPPMPWANLRAMEAGDLKAVYAYIRSLGPAGSVMPAPLPPGQEPTTPWLSMEPHFPAN